MVDFIFKCLYYIVPFHAECIIVFSEMLIQILAGATDCHS